MGFDKAPLLPSFVVEYGDLQQLEDDAFEGLPNLTRIDLSENKLITLNKAFKKIKKGGSINLSRNRLQSVNGAFEGLSHLTINLSKNRLESIDGAFKGLSHSEIDLSNNRLVSIDGAFEGVSHSKIDLSRNRLVSIDGAFEGVSHSQIDLSNNRLVSLHGAFKGLSHSKLDLSNNRLISLDGAFKGLSNSTIDIRGNYNLTSVDTHFKEMIENRNSMDMSDITIDCGCNLKWLAEDQNKLSYFKEHSGQVRCSNGEDLMEVLQKKLMDMVDDLRRYNGRDNFFRQTDDLEDKTILELV